MKWTSKHKNVLPQRVWDCVFYIHVCFHKEDGDSAIALQSNDHKPEIRKHTIFRDPTLL